MLKNVYLIYGQLAQTWRILLHQMEVQPKVATDVVKALTVLHNFIEIQEPPRSFLNEETAGDPCSTQSTHTFNSIDQPRYRASQRALEIREILVDYFMSTEGTVPLQNKHVFSKT